MKTPRIPLPALCLAVFLATVFAALAPWSAWLPPTPAPTPAPTVSFDTPF